MSAHQVKLIDNSSDQVLFKCDLEDIAKAYEQASQYESYGIDIRIEAPTLTETLVRSLGIEGDKLEKYHESVIAEIHDHEGCCNSKNDAIKN